jgi:hypothetical protein
VSRQGEFECVYPCRRRSATCMIGHPDEYKPAAPRCSGAQRDGPNTKEYLSWA